MSKEKHVVSKPTINEEAYFKSEYVKAKFIYTGLERDAMSVVLEDGKLYTKQEVKDLVENFLKGVV